EFLDAFAENANPVLGPTEVDHVTDIEMPADPGAVEFVHITGGLNGAEKEMIPDIFDGNFHSEFLGQGDCFADLGLRALVGVGVRNVPVDHSRYKQNRTCAVTFGVA